METPRSKKKRQDLARTNKYQENRDRNPDARQANNKKRAVAMKNLRAARKAAGNVKHWEYNFMFRLKIYAVRSMDVQILQWFRCIIKEVLFF